MDSKEFLQEAVKRLRGNLCHNGRFVACGGVATKELERIPVATLLKVGAKSLCKIAPELCAGNLGIKREDMPQLRGEDVKAFIAHMKAAGFPTKTTKIDPTKFHASQDAVSGIGVLKSSRKRKERPLIVSADGFVIDGHHRWASSLVRNVKSRVTAKMVFAPGPTVIRMANEFLKSRLTESAIKKIKGALCHNGQFVNCGAASGDNIFDGTGVKVAGFGGPMKTVQISLVGFNASAKIYTGRDGKQFILVDRILRDYREAATTAIQDYKLDDGQMDSVIELASHMAYRKINRIREDHPDVKEVFETEMAPLGITADDMTSFKLSSTSWSKNIRHFEDAKNDDADGVRRLNEFFGRELTEKEIGALVGAPPGSDIVVSTDYSPDKVSIVADHPMLKEFGRTIHRRSNGDISIHNEIFIKTNDAPKSFGLKVFAGQVVGAAKLGVKYIDTLAAGRPGSTIYNGYATWPLYGYDAPLDGYEVQDIGEQLGRTVRTILDVYETDVGENLWKTKVGSGREMYFRTSMNDQEPSKLNMALRSYRQLAKTLQKKGLKVPQEIRDFIGQEAPSKTVQGQLFKESLTETKTKIVGDLCRAGENGQFVSCSGIGIPSNPTPDASGRYPDEREEREEGSIFDGTGADVYFEEGSGSGEDEFIESEREFSASFKIYEASNLTITNPDGTETPIEIDDNGTVADSGMKFFDLDEITDSIYDEMEDHGDRAYARELAQSKYEELNDEGYIDLSELDTDTRDALGLTRLHTDSVDFTMTVSEPKENYRETSDPRDLLRSILGKRMDEADVAEMLGAPPGSTVTVKPHDDGESVIFDISHEHIEVCERTLHTNKEIHNDIFRKQQYSEDDPRHNETKSFGLKLFAGEVVGASIHGVKKIHTNAAGGASSEDHKYWTGYFAWPSYGYDALLRDDEVERISDALGREVKTVLDVVSTPDGYKLWKEKVGAGRYMEFNLRDNDQQKKSMTQLAKTLRKKGIKVPDRVLANAKYMPDPADSVPLASGDIQLGLFDPAVKKKIRKQYKRDQALDLMRTKAQFVADRAMLKLLRKPLKHVVESLSEATKKKIIGDLCHDGKFVSCKSLGKTEPDNLTGSQSVSLTGDEVFNGVGATVVVGEHYGSEFRLETATENIVFDVNVPIEERNIHTPSGENAAGGTEFTTTVRKSFRPKDVAYLVRQNFRGQFQQKLETGSTVTDYGFVSDGTFDALTDSVTAELVKRGFEANDDPSYGYAGSAITTYQSVKDLSVPVPFTKRIQVENPVKTPLEAAAKLFGRPVDQQEIAAIVGAPPGSRVNLTSSWLSYGGPNDTPSFRLNLSVEHDYINSMSRTILRNRDGKLEIHNDIFVKYDDAPKLFGLKVFAGQVQGALKHGVDVITTMAAGSHDDNTAFNGYATWPLYGYNANLRDNESEKFTTALKQPVSDVLDVVNVDYNYWQNHVGTGRHMWFSVRDRKDTAKSYRQLARILRRKGLKVPEAFLGMTLNPATDPAYPKVIAGGRKKQLALFKSKMSEDLRARVLGGLCS